jgi:hypothetical protein
MDVNAQVRPQGDKKMKGKKEWGILVFLFLVLISTLVFINHLRSEAENPDLSRAVFLVS